MASSYNRELKEIVDRNRSIISTAFHSNIDQLRSFFNEIKALVQRNSSIPRSDTYYKTFYMQMWNSMISFRGGGRLIGDSANCKFTIAKVRFVPQGNEIGMYFKIVNQASQLHPPHTRGGEDLVICDVVSATIMERLRSRYASISVHFPIYIDSSVGQYIGTRNQEYWTYNDIHYENEKSIHNYSSVINPYDKYITYKDRCVIMIYESVNLLSFEKVFTNYKNDKSSPTNVMKCLNVLFDFYDLVNSLKFLGVYYGFMHNDLHSANIIYNEDTGRVMIIDLGRVSYRKYIDSPSTQINADVAYQFYKLGYNDLYSDIRSGINSYKDLYSNKRLFRYRLSEKVSSSITDKNIYYGFIYDLITLTLQFYIKSLYFLSDRNPTLNNHIKPYLMNIVKINYGGNTNNLLSPYNFEMTTVDIPTLITNFNAAKDFISTLNDSHYIDAADVEKVKDFYNEIANGLLMTAIFFHASGAGIPGGRRMIINPRVHDPNDGYMFDPNMPMYWALQIMDNVKLSDFYVFLSHIYNDHRYTAAMNRIDFINAIFDSRIELPTDLSLGGTTMKENPHPEIHIGTTIKEDSYLVNGIDFGITPNKSTKSLKQYSFKILTPVFTTISKQKIDTNIEILIENYTDVMNNKFKQQINYPLINSDTEKEVKLSELKSIKSPRANSKSKSK
jgi:hypothetical protein